MNDEQWLVPRLRKVSDAVDPAGRRNFVSFEFQQYNVTRCLLGLLVLLSIGANQLEAKLSIRGDKANELLQMIAHCGCVEATMAADGTVGTTPAAELPPGCSRTFNNLVREIIQSPLDVILKTSHGDAHAFDTFHGRGEHTVDVEDWAALPETLPVEHPWGTTRCQMLIHVLAEAFHGARNAGKREGELKFSHAAGLEAENQYRAERGQEGRVIDHEAEGRPGWMITKYENGHADTHCYDDPANNRPEYR